MALFKNKMMLVTMVLFCTHSAFGYLMNECFIKANFNANDFPDLQKNLDGKDFGKIYENQASKLKEIFTCVGGSTDASPAQKKSIEEAQESMVHTEEQGRNASYCVKKNEKANASVCEQEKKQFVAAAKDLVYKAIELVRQFLPTKLVNFVVRVIAFGSSIGRKTVDIVAQGYRGLKKLFQMGAELLTKTGKELREFVISLKDLCVSVVHGVVSAVQCVWDKLPKFKGEDKEFKDFEQVEEEDSDRYLDFEKVQGNDNNYEDNIFAIGNSLILTLRVRVGENNSELTNDEKVLEELSMLYKELKEEEDKIVKNNGEDGLFGKNFAENSINALLYTYSNKQPAQNTLMEQIEWKKNDSLSVLERETFKETKEWSTMMTDMQEMMKGMTEQGDQMNVELENMLEKTNLSEEKKEEFRAEFSKQMEEMQELFKVSL